MKEFKCDVIKDIGTISTDGNYTKSVKLISFNDAAPKIDIRTWCGTKMLKGITLTRDEAKRLAEILNKEL